MRDGLYEKSKLWAILLFIWLIPAICFAHAGMLNSNPDQNSILTSSPAKVTIKMSAQVEPAFSSIEVYNLDDEKISGKTRFRKKNMVMETDLPDNLSPGMYSVKWKCMSLDGHTLSGDYTFTVEQ
jgi:methionine-rich copper-binding protein CopC